MGWNHTSEYKNCVAGVQFAKQEYDFRPKFHDTKFSYHLIIFFITKQVFKKRF
jgi:hypothetical protein